jgi:hypothetical protein
MNIFENEHNTIIFLLVVIIVWLFYLTFRAPSYPSILEGLDMSDEAIQNLASIYKTGEMEVTNLKVTGNATVTGTLTNSGITNRMNGLQSQINTKQPRGAYVKYGDEFAIRNKYGNWASYLDTCGGVSPCNPGGSDGFGVNTTRSKSRGYPTLQTATTTWKLEKV